MFAFFKRRLKLEPISQEAAALAEVQQKWRSARADYVRCRENKDKRAMGEALKRVTRLAREAMRLELGR